MAYVFACPECASTLKTGVPLPAGRSIQCPKCRHTFTAADTQVREETSPPYATEANETTPQQDYPRSRRNEADEPTRRREEDDEPRSRRRDDDDEPRRRDDDDEPRRRRRYEDDDDEPRRRGDDDDRPRSRRRYDDDFDRPRRKPKKGSPVAVIVVLVLLGLGGIGALLWFLFDDDKQVASSPFAPGVDTEMLALVPADAVVLAGIDVEKLCQNGKFAKFVGSSFMRNMPDQQTLQRKIEEAGMSERDISGLLVSMSKLGGSGPVFIIRFNKDVDKDRLLKAFNADKHMHKMKTYYTSGVLGGSQFFFVGNRLLVGADSRSTLFDLMTHDRTNIRLPQSLRDLAAKAKGEYWLLMKKDGGMAAMQGLGFAFGNDLFDGPANRAEILLVSIAAQNDQIECDLGLKMTGDRDASDVVQQMQAEIEGIRRVGIDNHPNFRFMPPDQRNVVRAIQQSATFRSEGNVAFLKYRVGIDLFGRMMEMQQGGGGMNRPKF